MRSAVGDLSFSDSFVEFTIASVLSNVMSPLLKHRKNFIHQNVYISDEGAKMNDYHNTYKSCAE